MSSYSSITRGDSSPPRRTSAWGWILAYGLALIALGVVAMSNIAISAAAVGMLLGISLAVFGAIALVAGISALSGRARWIEIALGVLSLIAGILTVFNPLSGAMSLVWLIGAWLLIAGIFEVISVIQIPINRGWRLFMGVLDMALGGILFFSGPMQSLAILATIVGISFLCRGVFMLVVAFAIRRAIR